MKKQRKSLLSGIYIVREEGSNLCKIGMSNDFSKRLSSLQAANSKKLILELGVITGSPRVTRNIESAIHDSLKLSGKHIRGEWFKLSHDDIGKLEYDLVTGAEC